MYCNGFRTYDVYQMFEYIKRWDPMTVTVSLDNPNIMFDYNSNFWCCTFTPAQLVNSLTPQQKFAIQRPSSGFDSFPSYKHQKHFKKIQKADLSFPIILHPDFRVIDGMHRIAQCKVRGMTTIQAYVFNRETMDLFILY